MSSNHRKPVRPVRRNHRPLRATRRRGTPKVRQRIGRRGQFERLEHRLVLAAPTLPALSTVTLLSGTTLHIPLDAEDSDGDALSFTATSTNPDVTASIPQGNRSLKITVPGFGEMVLELFETEAPRTTARIIELANQGFYDGLKFHRVVNGFVIQGGDPLGNGTGGSGVDFDDEFNPLLRHTSRGVLSMAKSNDDTNDSQFFITEAPTRHLDFNHSVFGFLTEGESVREAISNVTVNSAGKPAVDVIMQTVDVVVDQENGVLRLTAPEGKTGVAAVTVRVSDGQGGTAERTFQVNIVADTTNDTPFLLPIAPPTTTRGAPVTFRLRARDVEGNPIIFGFDADNSKVAVQLGATQVNPVNQIAETTVTLTPQSGFAGTTPIVFFAHAPNAQVNHSVGDFQTVTLTVAGVATPGPIDLTADTGINGDNITSIDNSTTAKRLEFTVGNITPGAVVTLFAGATAIGTVTATSTVGTIVTNGATDLADGFYNITVRQTIGGEQSPASTPLVIGIDTVAPVFTSAAPTSVLAGGLYSYLPLFEGGSQGLSRQLVTAPAGMTINPASGLITWRPTFAQVGSHQARIRATDPAGNQTEQLFTVQVIQVPNDAPVLGAIADRQVDEGGLIELTATATDPNPGDSLRFSLGANPPAGAAIDPASGRFSWRPSEAQGPGRFTVTIQVADLLGATDSQSFDVAVAEVNQPPVIQPVGDLSVLPGADAALDIDASDPDLPATGLTFRLVEGPEGATVDPVTGAFRWTAPIDPRAGQFTATVEAAEQGPNGATATVTFQINVFNFGLGFLTALLPRGEAPSLDGADDLATLFLLDPAASAADAQAPAAPVIDLLDSFDLGEEGEERESLIGPDTGLGRQPEPGDPKPQVDERPERPQINRPEEDLPSGETALPGDEQVSRRPDDLRLNGEADSIDNVLANYEFEPDAASNDAQVIVRRRKRAESTSEKEIVAPPPPLVLDEQELAELLPWTWATADDPQGERHVKERVAPRDPYQRRVEADPSQSHQPESSDRTTQTRHRRLRAPEAIEA